MARPILLSWTILMILACPLGLSASGGGFQSPPEWTADRRLTAGPGEPGLSLNFARTIAADPEGMVHVVWFDTRNEVAQIYYKRSMDGGRIWSPDLPLSQSLKGAVHPTIAVDGPDLFVAWHDFRLGRPDIFLRHSSNRGMSWQPERRLTTDLVPGAHPSVAASADGVHVVWGGGTEGSAEVYIRSSLDKGERWSPPAEVSERPSASWVGTVAASGRDVYVAWVDYKDANEEEYLRHSPDGGASWDPPIRLTHDAADSWAPSLAVSGNIVHIVWFDRRSAGLTDVDVEGRLNRVLSLFGHDAEPPPPRDPQVYYLYPFLRRVQYKVDRIQSILPQWVQMGGDVRQFEGLFRDFQQAMLDWTTGWEVYYKRSTDGGATWGKDTRLTRAAGASARPSLAIGDDRTLHVVWFDGRDGELEVYYKASRDEGDSWDPDVRLTVAPGDSELPSVAVSGHAVHVAWIDRRSGEPELYYKRKER
jgi:hypothetical protein